MRFISLIPPKNLTSRSFSLLNSTVSFLGSTSNVQSSSLRSIYLLRLIRLSIVSKLDNVPPHQHSLTQNIPERSASSRTDSCACFLVPKNKAVPPSADKSLTKL